MAAKTTEVMELLQAISNTITTRSRDQGVSELMMWMLVQEEARRNIERLDVNYD